MIREGSIQIPFTFAAGKTGSRFLVGLRDNQTIRGSKCPECGKVFCPPRPICPYCFRDELDFVDVGPGGELVSLTEVPGQELFGLIKLDGADTAMLHKLIGNVSEFCVGTRVVARFAANRCASILDIEGFVLAEDASIENREANFQGR